MCSTTRRSVTILLSDPGIYGWVPAAGAILDRVEASSSLDLGWRRPASSGSRACGSDAAEGRSELRQWLAPRKRPSSAPLPFAPTRARRLMAGRLSFPGSIRNDQP
jgi:hypothetical protein